MPSLNCGCECNRGGFCGGCGHAGCSGGINVIRIKRDRDCEDSPDGQHRWSGEDTDFRCYDCDRKPWYETATVEGRRRKADREAAIEKENAMKFRTDYSEDKVCPRCNEDHLPIGYGGALSRADNETEVCSACGTDEAMVQFNNGGLLQPTTMWPVQRTFR